MDAFIIMFKSVFIFVALAIPGYILGKLGLVKSSQTISLSRVLTYLGIPFLVFDSTLGVSFSGNTLNVILWAGFLTIAYILIWFFLSAIFCYKNFGDDKNTAISRFAMFSSNNGFLGIPIASVVLGPSDAFAGLIIANVLTNTLMYILGIYIISGDKKQISLKKIIFNPVLIAFILGIIVNILNVKQYVPEVKSYSSYMSGVVIPLAMIILGLKLSDVKFSSLFSYKKLYYVSALKLIVNPILIIGVMLLLKLVLPVQNSIILSMFMAFSMPVATVVTTFADQFNGDTNAAVIYTLGTTIFSVITIPILYYLLNLCL